MKIKLLLLVILLQSCANFINKIDDDLLTQKSIPFKKENSKPTYCEVEPPLSLISEDRKAQETFAAFVANSKFTFIEKLVLWTFVQMTLRPDMSSPGASFQVMTNINDNQNYFYFYSQNTASAYPVFYGLDSLLKRHRSHFSLYQLAEIFDRKYPNDFYVSAQFENFLTENLKEVQKDPILKKLYTRADEPLREKERLPKPRFTPLVKLYLAGLKKSEYKTNDYLFDYKRNNLIEARCNYDMSLYNSSIYLIQEKMLQSNTFGMRENNQRFMAITTQSLTGFTSLNASSFFTLEEKPSIPVMCKFTDPYDKQNQIWLTSTDSRDPGQHLHHLIEYGLYNIKSISELDTMIRFSRHLFLKKPVRLILESERSSEEQLAELLKLNIPIYNSAKLGKIWGYFQNKKGSHFVFDDRREGSLLCLKK